MSTAQAILLGAIAGSTIFLGLPLGRLRRPHKRLKAVLNGVSAGILLFLLVEIVDHAFSPLEAAVERAHRGTGSWTSVTAMGFVFVAGLTVGLISLLYLTKWQRARSVSAGLPQSVGPGAMAVTEAMAETREAMHLGMSVAAGIGLHNFSEGLAIGQSARAGEVSLAVLLVVGFALHNATEGFGIVGPLAAGGVRASWPYLAFAGLIAGGPTFLGTVVGTAYTSPYVSVLFLALAAGAIIYVIPEILNVGRKLGAWDLTVWGVLGGFFLALITELVIRAAGV
ncbi:MAG TPA: ZIP family metal transporter [Actinomycetota bacterium]